jgi:hypothetical protein
MTHDHTRKPRIVICGVGQYGGYVTRFAVEKGWPVVAAFNRAGAKIGKDCDTASYAGLGADIAVVTQTNLLSINFSAYERLMNAGMNVLCHGSESYYPFGCNAEIAAKIDRLAERNGVTFTGSGIWDMSRIWAGVLVAGPCTEIKSLFHSSITDAVGQAINLEQAQQVGIGLTTTVFTERGYGRSPLAISYKTIPEQVLTTLGFRVTDTRVQVEPVVFDDDVPNPWNGSIVPAGHCVGTRIIAEIFTAQGTTARAEIELRLFREGETEHMLWVVDGKPRTRIRTERLDSAHATAACLFNRIPDVIAAPPGIVLITQMGPLKSTAAGADPGQTATEPAVP